MRRLITILLCLTTLVTSFALFGCADTDENVNHGSVDNRLEHLAGLDFGGEVVSIVYVEGGNGQFTERSLGLSIDDDTADSVDKKVIQRNAEVTAMINVFIEPIKGANGFADLSGAISSSLAAGNGDYDVIAGYQYFDIGLASKGYLLNLNTLADYGADYLRLDADYWSAPYNGALEYNGSTYWITGDLALRYLGGMYCTFVNGDIYDSVLKSTYGSIYDVVRAGDWTLDTILAMSEAIYQDDGNGSTDENDRLGFVLETTMDPIDGMAYGSAITWSQKSEGDVNIVFRNTRTIDFGEKMSDIVSSRSFYAPAGDDSKNQMALFSNGNVGFTVASVFHAEVGLREMDNFYVVPVPKLNKEQESYSSGIHDGCTIFGIPHDAPDYAMSAATLEALAAESKRLVTPEYYDSALKYKYTRDEEAAEMIDLMRDTAYTDFVAAWSKDINDIAHFFRDNYKNLRQINSKMQKNADRWNTSLNTLLSHLDEYSIG